MRSSASSWARAERAGGHEGRGRHRRRESDQCKRPAAAQKGKGAVAGCLVAGKIIAECLHKTMSRGADIGVVIARDRRHGSGRPHTSEPLPRRAEFRFQREIDEIAGDGDVVGGLRLHVGDQRVQHLAAIIFAAVAGPVEIAERAFACEFGQPRFGQRRQMRVRQMRELEGRHRHLLARGPCRRKIKHDVGKHGETTPEAGAAVAACFPSLLALCPRHDARRPRRGAGRDNRVFLVRHSYVTGWYLPGGGVEVGETFADALKRELIEEGCIELSGEPALHGLFHNVHVSRRDHVAVYIVRQFRQDRTPEPNHEIAPAASSRRVRCRRGRRWARGCGSRKYWTAGRRSGRGARCELSGGCPSGPIRESVRRFCDAPQEDRAGSRFEESSSRSR